MPAETTILDVFGRAGIDGRLLILGEPGAGKMTTMLDLAEKLCDRAEENAAAFIPVLLNLSSWKDPKQTMIAWLVEELRSKYGVRKNVGTQWLAEKQLLPLLDGLDEVKPEHQEGCVQAINRWLESEDRPPSLAVCCRREEYEKVVRCQWQVDAEEPQDETRMHLNGAILLQTLTDEQIQAYLTAANQPELWQMLRQDEALWELIRTPLWLSITLLSYEGLSLSQWQQTTSTEQRLSLLLDAYVERMLHKAKGKAFDRPDLPFRSNLLKRLIYQAQFSWLKPPSTKKMRHWLVYLAQQLQRESQTELSLEMIQPSWLITSLQKWFYRLSTCLVSGLTVGMITSLNYGLPLDLLRLIQQSTAYTQFEITFNSAYHGYLAGLTIALVVMLFSWRTRKEIITPIEILRWSQTKVRSTFLSWSRAGMNWGAITGFLVGALVSLDCIYPGFLKSIGLSKEAYKAKPFFTGITDGYIAIICCLILWLALEVFLC